MSVFSWFGSKSNPEVIIRKHAPRVANRRAQAPDRWESIQALGRAATPGAMEALLARFNFYVEPSIIDQEEKDAVFQILVAQREAAFEPVLRMLRRSESISWPLKVLSSWLTPSELVEELLRLLEPMDTEYERDPQRKIQILSALHAFADERVAPAVQRFLSDVNETVRFHAVEAILAQPNASEWQSALLAIVPGEESSRIRALVLGHAAQAKWNVGNALQDLQRVLPPGFRVSPDGTVHKLA
jgi:hypothetical protein